VFGLSFGEIAVIAIVALVILGPRELPMMLRSLGRGISKLRRVSTDLRKQSGIDEIIREEGLQEELQALRALRGMSGAGMVESFIENASKPREHGTNSVEAAGEAPLLEQPEPIVLDGSPPDPVVEYPEIGCDAYGASYEPAAAVARDEDSATDDADPARSADPAPTAEAGEVVT
jgi:sec-independent protein translocase protein TatB